MKVMYRKQQRWIRGLIPVGLLWLGFIQNAFSYDGKLEPYERVAGISGNLSSIGSDTLANMMTLWAEDFQRIYPKVNIQIQASGSIFYRTSSINSKYCSIWPNEPTDAAK